MVPSSCNKDQTGRYSRAHFEASLTAAEGQQQLVNLYRHDTDAPHDYWKAAYQPSCWPAHREENNLQ